MNILITAFMLFYLMNVMVGAIMEGGGGIAATRLTADITPASNTLSVVSTEGFLRSNYVIIGSEKIRYASTTDTTMVVATGGRGWDGTDAAAHSTGAYVYSPEASVFNYALGFNVASTGSDAGEISVPLVLKNFLFVTLPKLVTWDFPQYKVNAWLLIIRYVLIAISTGFLIYIVYHIIMFLGGVASRIFTRV